MIHIPIDLWYADGYTYTVVELQGVVRKDVEANIKIDGNTMYVQVTQPFFDGRILEVDIQPKANKQFDLIQ